MPAVTTSQPRPLRDLLHGPRTSLRVVRPADVGGTAAWQVLVHDGVLRVLRADAACPVDQVVDAPLRSSLLAPDLPAGTVVTARTAVWVHTGTGRPETLDLTYPAGRHRPDRPVGARLWQGHLLGPDTVRLGGVPVTTPQRTLVELVLHGTGPEETAALAAALARTGADLRRARRAIEARTRVAARRPAHAALAAAAELLASDDGRAGAPAPA